MNGVYVRGGSPDQNLVILDGVPVYNVSHLLGFLSVFNTDAIKGVSLTKGVFLHATEDDCHPLLKLT